MVVATAVAPRPRLRAPVLPRDPRLVRAAGVAAFALLLLLSLFVRTRALGGQFWMDEGLSVGIASHPFTAIPEVLRQDGSPPLYYLLLHVWMKLFGSSESATHSLSLLAAMLTIPVGLWAGWSMFGRRAGIVCAFLCALNPFLTLYAQETRMYGLLGLEGLIACTLVVHVFVLRRRRWQLPALVLAITALIYTHGWGIFFAASCAGCVLWFVLRSPDRRDLVKDGLIAFGGAALLYLPWLPTLLEQSAHTAAPWSKAPRFGAPIQISRGLAGGDRSGITLLLVGGAGIAPVMARTRGDDPQRRSAILLLQIAVGTLALAWILSQITPAWTTRYFGVVLGPLIVLAAAGIARTGKLGLVALAALTFFWVNPKQYTGYQKSDLRDIAADIRPQLRKGDLAISAQPEQVPALAYYLGPDLNYAAPDSGKIDPDPYVMDWRDALARFQSTAPEPALRGLVASLRPGQRVLLVRPFTEGVEQWSAPWTTLIRRRSAQWGRILASDRQLKLIATAPRIYRGATTVGNSAVLYEKTG